MSVAISQAWLYSIGDTPPIGDKAVRWLTRDEFDLFFLWGVVVWSMWTQDTTNHKLSDRLEKVEKKLKDAVSRLGDVEFHKADRDELPPPPDRDNVAEARARAHAEKLATERNEHNREVKRRMKARKAAAIEAARQEELHRTAQAVIKSSEQERAWRDAIAAEQGWPIHPNDMELEPEQMKIVLEAFVQKKPMPDFCR
jgi:Asp-tRNA(Asn)/Glu-tRNA(Gln) amidotransferase A subunit family amidase